MQISLDDTKVLKPWDKVTPNSSHCSIRYKSWSEPRRHFIACPHLLVIETTSCLSMSLIFVLPAWHCTSSGVFSGGGTRHYPQGRLDGHSLGISSTLGQMSRIKCLELWAINMASTYSGHTANKPHSTLGPIMTIRALGTRYVVLNSFKVTKDLLEQRSGITSNRPHSTVAGDLVG